MKKLEFTPFNAVIDKGFTLVELMVAVVLSGMVLAAFVTMFSTSSRSLLEQTVTADLQQELRATMKVMQNYIVMAGYDPLKTGEFSIEQASGTNLRFSLDKNSNGTKDTPAAGSIYSDSEVYTFTFAGQGVQMVFSEATGVSEVETLMGGADSPIIVTALTFEYRNGQDQVTTIASDIRAVIVRITAQAPAGRSGMIQRTYSTRVAFRNVG